jgi:hypothetical protein
VCHLHVHGNEKKDFEMAQEAHSPQEEYQYYIKDPSKEAFRLGQMRQFKNLLNASS